MLHGPLALPHLTSPYKGEGKMCKRQAGRKIPCEREKDDRRRHCPERLSRRRDSCRHQTRAPLLDLALLASTHPGVMAGVFTQNCIMAAPVLLGRRQLTKHTGQAIIVNSGNANALTGSQGMTDAMEMRKLVSTALRLPVSSVFVGSTGVISRHFADARHPSSHPASHPTFEPVRS